MTSRRLEAATVTCTVVIGLVASLAPAFPRKSRSRSRAASWFAPASAAVAIRSFGGLDRHSADPASGETMLFHTLHLPGRFPAQYLK